MHKGTHISEDDRSAGSVGGASAPVSSLRPRRGDPVIQIRAYRRPIGSEEASDPDTFESIGSLAVHLVARFSLPRMQMTLAQGRRGRNPAPASAHDPSWEDSDA
jgi:hypothetical protein